MLQSDVSSFLTCNVRIYQKAYQQLCHHTSQDKINPSKKLRKKTQVKKKEVMPAAFLKDPTPCTSPHPLHPTPSRTCDSWRQEKSGTCSHKALSLTSTCH